MSQMTPREIVQELDKHIIGQDSAKRAVAIALRNRWRRSQVNESLRNEITPKNILTPETRTSLVYAVEVTIENKEKVLKHGMPVVITL